MINILKLIYRAVYGYMWVWDRLQNLAVYGTAILQNYLKVLVMGQKKLSKLIYQAVYGTDKLL